MSPLNARQRAFVRAYTSGKTLGNGTRSAEKAGYNGSDETLAVTAHDLLKHPKVAEAIASREQDADDASIADRYEREQFLAAVMRGEVTEAPVEDDDDGYSLPPKPQPVAMRDRLKAVELLGKMGGDFIERREITGKDGAPLPSFTLSIEAARELAAKGAK